MDHGMWMGEKLSENGVKLYTSLFTVTFAFEKMMAYFSKRFASVPRLFSVGYFPIENFLKDISLSDKCPSEFLPIMDFYPLCFAHQE